MRGERTNAASMVVVPISATTKAAADRFTGDAWVDAITNGAGPGCARLATVRFSPGARTAWHCHAHGQTLHVTSGVGLVQTRDGQTIVMRPGDTVYTPPGVWHWHGALPDFFMTHLAMADSSAQPGAADVEWGLHVADDEYAAATTGAATEESTR
jgi:quercetin dioxygenase-like cupin family protein